MPYKGDHTTPAEPRVHSRLAAVRRKRGMAAAALASASGVSRQTIYAIEAGDYLPNTVVALRLASALETRVEDLFQLAEIADYRYGSASHSQPLFLFIECYMHIADASIIETWRGPAHVNQCLIPRQHLGMVADLEFLPFQF